MPYSSFENNENNMRFTSNILLLIYSSNYPSYLKKYSLYLSLEFDRTNEILNSTLILFLNEYNKEDITSLANTIEGTSIILSNYSIYLKEDCLEDKVHNLSTELENIVVGTFDDNFSSDKDMSLPRIDSEHTLVSLENYLEELDSDCNLFLPFIDIYCFEI